MKQAAQRSTLTLLSIVLIGTILFINHSVNLSLPLTQFVYDQQSKILSPQLIPSSNIIVIRIDDASIRRMTTYAGRWPWPRSTHAELIESLNEHNVKVIAFDILFSEPDRYRPDADSYFKEVLLESPHVMLAALVLDVFENHDEAKAGKIDQQIEHELRLLSPQFMIESPNQIGLINSHKDSDAVIRKHRLHTSLAGTRYASLPYRVSQFVKPQQHSINEIQLQWRGPLQAGYHSVSYADVYQAILDNEQTFLSQFNNKIVLIGATSAGLYDAVNTPVNSNLPGVYVLANAIDNLLSKHYYLSLPNYYLVVVSLLSVLVIAAIFTLCNSLLKQVIYSHIVIFSVMACAWFINLELMRNSTLFNLGHYYFVCLISLFIPSVVYSIYEYFNRVKAQSLFGRFVDPIVVNQLLSEETHVNRQSAKRCHCTLLFSDIRGFTQLSEHSDEIEILQLLNDYFVKQVAVVFEHKGTLDKFIGDCIMAFWGAPLTQEDHALRAVRAAISMEQELIKFKQTLAPKYANFDIGIGLHSGDVICGFVGTTSRVDYTVLGDAVNLASRIEGLTKQHDRILVSEQTRDLARAEFEFNFVGEFSVKGREQTVNLYTPIR